MALYPQWWRKRFLSVELVIALMVAAALIGWCTWGTGRDFLTPLVNGSRAAIYGTLATLAGSLLGFVIATQSIALGFIAAPRFKVLQNSEAYRQLWDVFVSAIRVLGWTTLGWLVALFFDRENSPKPLIFELCLGISFLALLRLIRCVWVLENLVRILTAPRRD